MANFNFDEHPHDPHEETNRNGISYRQLIYMRLKNSTLWSYDLFQLEEYANSRDARQTLEVYVPAPKELPG